MKIKYLLYLFILLIFLSACESVDEDLFDTEKLLITNTWILTSVTDYDTDNAFIQLPNEISNSISFMSDSSFSLSTYCNSGGGNYEVTSDSISFWNIYLTERECVVINRYGWESLIVNGLYAATSYEIHNDELIIRTSENYSFYFKVYRDTTITTTTIK